jgi:hypothetical protein
MNSSLSISESENWLQGREKAPSLPLSNERQAVVKASTKDRKKEMLSETDRNVR